MSVATIDCPMCGAAMVLKWSTRYPYRNGEPRRFYGCVNYPDCTATCGAHPDGTPSSTPAGPETKKARSRAHDVFDPIWQSGRMTRRQAYLWLQQAMGMTRDEAHIGLFDMAQCERLIRIVESAFEYGRL